MSDKSIISNEFNLPSKGKFYSKLFKPTIRLRSMTTEDEMRRLSHSERPYKVMCDLIDSCIDGDKPPISVYDMCIADYQYLLHCLRIVTYGTEYKVSNTCPYCATENVQTLDLNSIVVNEYTDELEKYREFKLPVSGSLITIHPQTPRGFDDIVVRNKANQVKNKTAVDMTYLYTLSSIVDTVDGEPMDLIKLENYLRKLPLKDSNYILQCSKKLNDGIGIDTSLVLNCPECGLDYNSSFRVTSEFFGPSID